MTKITAQTHTPPPSTPRVLVLGDAFTDVYWQGTASRVSPEAPVLVVDVQQTNVLKMLGGAANVHANLVGLGVQADLLASTPPWPSKNRLLAGKQQLVRWDVEDYCLPIALKSFAQRMASVEYSALVVSDYVKGSITPELYTMISASRLPVFVDTKASPAPWLGVARVVFPNIHEYEAHQEAYDNFEMVVLKQGARGAALLSLGHVVAHEPSRASKVVSVCGAGDTVLAAFVASWCKTKSLAWPDLRTSLSYAMQAAASAVEKPYTSVVQAGDLCK